MAPGEGVISLGTSGKPVAFGGTSAAAPIRRRNDSAFMVGVSERDFDTS